MKRIIKVLVCDEIHCEGIDIMKDAGITVDVKLDLKPEELKEALKSYDGVIIRSRTKIGKDVIEAASNLKFIARAGVGMDNIDVQTAERMGMKVISAPEAASQSVAEHTFGLMVAIARKVALADRSVKEGMWIKSQLVTSQLSGKTLGIIGFGRIGFRVAKIAQALGMRILVYDILLRDKQLEEVGAEAVTLERLLAESDVITVHTPLTDETKQLVGEKEFSMMKKKPIIINTARGYILDEKALYNALESGKISGAGLDVYEVEPPMNLELLCHANVVCTPHIAAQTEEAQREASLQLARKIVEYVKSLT